MKRNDFGKFGLPPLEEVLGRVEENVGGDGSGHPDFYDVNCPTKEDRIGNGRVQVGRKVALDLCKRPHYKVVCIYHPGTYLCHVNPDSIADCPYSRP